MAEILIVTGLQREAAILRRALTSARAGSAPEGSAPGLPAPDIAVTCGGPGPAGVARAVQTALGDEGVAKPGGRPRLLLSMGLAGALVPGPGAGDVCWPVEVADAQDRVHRAAPLPPDVAARFGIMVGGRLFSSAEPLADAPAKAAAHADHGALLVDMESFALAEIAARLAIPFGALRVVADEAGDRLPSAVLAATDGRGALHPVRLIAALAGRPGEWRDFARLARRGRRAERRLGRVGAALPQILLPLLG